MVFDVVAAAKQHKAELSQFYMSPTTWRDFKLAHPLSWESVPFSEASRALVPKVRGVYVFSVSLTDHNLPPHGYMMYAGMTGHTGDSQLHARYGQYLSEPKKKKGRPTVANLITNWKDALTFTYATVPDASVSLRDIERAFLDAVRPPMNFKDFSAEVAKAIKAAF